MGMNPYQKYKEETVMTMTQGELLLLLYDELVKRLAAAELLLDQGDHPNFEKRMTEAADIVRYFCETLDFQYPISQELYRMYDFFLVEFSRVRASRKKEALGKVRILVQDLRDTFREAEKRAAV